MKAERSLLTLPKVRKLGSWLLLLAAVGVIGLAQSVNEHHHHAAAGLALRGV